MRPRLLDLFCGAGGAAMGYHRAGFDVVGVDINPQPHYPFEFQRRDITEWFGAEGLAHHLSLEWDAIHASPPCQAFTTMSNRWRGGGGLADDRGDLLTPTLELLRQLPVPWVVENVLGAAKTMRPTLKLHGGMFGLGVYRPRLFESNVLLLAPRSAKPSTSVGVYGKAPDGRMLRDSSSLKRWHGRRDDGRSFQRAAGSLEEAQQAMGMDWADWRGTKEAIPPAYSEAIGAQLLAYIERREVPA